MKEKYTVPIYQKIALDLANKIHTGEVKEGSTLYGRSILAGKYNVSPETIWRAIKLLEDIDIVESIKGKGVTVLSSDNALSFIKKYEDINNISSYKSNLYKLLENKSKIDSEIILTLNKIDTDNAAETDIKSVFSLEEEVRNLTLLTDERAKARKARARSLK